MFKNLSYKKKLRLLWIAALFMLLISYRFSISKTMDEYSSYKQNKQLAASAVSENSIENLSLKNKMLDKVLEKFILDTLNDEKNLLQVIAPLCRDNNLRLKEYKPLAVTKPDSLKIFTRTLTLEGGFIDCVKLIYNLETKTNTGRVSSVLFKSYMGPGEAKPNLNCTIYVQNIIP